MRLSIKKRRNFFVFFLAFCLITWLIIGNHHIFTLHIIYVEDRDAPILSQADLSDFKYNLRKYMYQIYSVIIYNIDIRTERLSNDDVSRTPDLPTSFTAEELNDIHSAFIKKAKHLTTLDRIRFYIEYLKDKTQYTGESDTTLINIAFDDAITKYIKLLQIRRPDGQILANVSFNDIFHFPKNYKRGSYDLVLYNGFNVKDLRYLYADDSSYKMAVSIFLRGGLFNGIAHIKGKIAFVNTMPILSDSPPFSDFKDSKLTHKQKILSIVQVTCHEFGHLYFNYDHTYLDEECIMYQVPIYNYKKSLNALKSCKHYFYMDKLEDYAPRFNK